MKISEILVDSIKYPLDNDEDFTNVIVLFGIPVVGIIIYLLFIGLAGAFGYNSYGYSDAAAGVLAIGMIIMYLFYLAFYLLCPGYMLSVMDEGINQSDVIPAINVGKNIVDTIKLAILGFIYFIIPVIIGVAVLFVAGFFSGLLTSFSYYYSPLALVGSMGIGGLIALLIFAFFEILYTIAVLRMARFDSLGAALSFGEVWADLKDIGIVKMIMLYAAIASISGFALVGSLALAIVFPYVGIFAILLIVAPALSLFSSYAFGLLYSEIA
jgi:hypothetical protein